MNNIDTTGKIKFTMSVANGSVLEFLDLSLHINEHNKICVDVYAKPTNSFTYCYLQLVTLRRTLTMFPKGLHLDLGEYAIQMKNLILGVQNI